jgi:hypothetical protein
MQRRGGPEQVPQIALRPAGDVAGARNIASQVAFGGADEWR